MCGILEYIVGNYLFFILPYEKILFFQTVDYKIYSTCIDGQNASCFENHVYILNWCEYEGYYKLESFLLIWPRSKFYFYTSF